MSATTRDAGIRTVALVAKSGGGPVLGHLARLADWLSANGYEVLVDSDSAEALPGRPWTAGQLAQLAQRADLGIALGGDATMLDLALSFAPLGVPVVGVHLGGLGFLTDLSPETMLTVIPEMLAGRCVVEHRMMLECEAASEDGTVFRSLALNDVVVAKSPESRLIELECRVDGRLLYRQRSDGLILSTPTGSTAHGLSAGGPIVQPDMDAILIVPLAAQTLSQRPLVTSAKRRVEVSLVGGAEAVVYVDGRTAAQLRPGGRVAAWRSEFALRLLKPIAHDYYDMLRRKLGWAASPT